MKTTPLYRNITSRVMVLCAIILCVYPSAKAQDGAVIRPVVSAFTLDVGAASLLDTYLTPIRYHGTNLRLGYERMQAMKFSPHKYVMQMDAAIDYDHVKNPGGNHTMHSLMIDYKWGMMRRFTAVAPQLQLLAGGSTQFRGGVIYNANNSNNPVSAKINWSVNLTGGAIYNIKIGKLPVTLRYQATLPFAGVFFTPEYGESYYEIYLGNRKGLVHLGWWGNRFDMTNLVTADLHFNHTILRLGYRNSIESCFVNNLNTQIYTNSAVIGIAGEWMSLKPGKASTDKARIISAMY